MTAEHSFPRLLLRRAQNEADFASCVAIRLKVFVEEQGVSVEEEMDGIDDLCLHYLALESANLRPVATARLIPKGSTAKIGRVAVVREARGQGVGLALMKFVLSDARQAGYADSILDSQSYATAFYERLGYKTEGDEFLDAGIPHLRMRLSLAPAGAAY